jgi:diacylglycerol kinase (ATP)
MLPAIPLTAPQQPSPAQPAAPTPATGLEPCAYKSRSGWQRVWRAAGYSWAGLRAAVRHEAAFRQELAIGLPALVLAWWLAPTPLLALLLSATVVGVWVVELLNSGLEALADAVSVQNHPLIGRAKDMGSAAVMLSLCLAVATWLVVLWP